MTLTDLLPSPRFSMRRRLEPGIWPRNARWDSRGEFGVGEIPLVDLARRHGDTVHVVDERDVRASCAAYAGAA